MEIINRIQLLEKFLSFMKKEGLDMFVVSATDEYLSEYNRLEANSRYLLTGFSGSTGDAVVTHERVFLFVDGRYHLQADMEVNHDYVEVVKVGMDKSPQTAMFEKLAELSGEGAKIGIVSSKMSCSAYKELMQKLGGACSNTDEVRTVVEYEHDPLLVMAGIEQGVQTQSNIREVPLNIAGKTTKEKLNEVNAFCAENGIDMLLITSLPEIAWLTNLRGEEIAYSSCYKAKAAVFREQLHVFRDENEFEKFICETENVLNVYYYPASTTLATLRKLERQFKNIIELKESPIARMKAIKTPEELEHYREIFLKTDIVVHRTFTWLNQSLEHGLKVSEKAFSDKVKMLFAEEGATGLSFEPIAASGKNTAVIHYTTPDENQLIEAGELVLLDCGGYFEGGYATDQTRTFLAGSSGVQDWQKKVYTAVLKGFLRGLNF
ncbi:MAG: M24 family metallopeptidase, partial [Candidatus Gastranaerophilales bacterium]|nr:M24 family metallopeptidase [Candidatus Gastranaerophilales bacterium]